MDYTVHELVALAGSGSLGAVALRLQSQESGINEATLTAQMAGHLAMMRDSVRAGLDPSLRSVSGLT
ncbi:MAG: hypothetical protein IJ461_03810, partial [Clostridia bacterium]|nr:hypothetical protein [Clostridia bacterium]